MQGRREKGGEQPAGLAGGQRQQAAGWSGFLCALLPAGSKPGKGEGGGGEGGKVPGDKDGGRRRARTGRTTRQRGRP